MKQLIFIEHTNRGMGLMLLVGFLLILNFSCGLGKQSSRADINSLEELNQIVESRSFEIEHDWAEPLNGNRVNIMDNPNYIRFKGDSVKLFLPFFGERYSGGNYGGIDGGIQFEGVPQEFEITEAKNSRNLTIKFSAEEDQEYYDFLVILYSNGKVSTSVNSSERSSISYRGHVQELTE